MPVQVRPGPESDALTRSRAEAAQELQASELEQIRQHAANWRNGLSALLGLITTVSIVKGRDTIVGLSQGAQVLVGVLLALALGAASVGTLLSLRAAYGFPKQRPVGQSPGDLRERRRERAKSASRDLRWAVTLTFLTLLLLAAGVGVTWYGPRGVPAYLEITDQEQHRTCGELVEGGATSVTLEASGTRSKVPLQDVVAMEVVGRCSS
ncbi:hypothetical protein GCM10011512_16390 [Tersicoccus solisilvae]|uniref:DUF202 domain-containing protein n=1 Tax=Tersicoccus solisilvae TaxID=1882339 RepID=A0ABQ1P451_9MICC|nr:hypothetical protein GCM10011512_16390 [Tersicoccus solisilvae]